jgi:phospholipid transport system substrate-binding protein
MRMRARWYAVLTLGVGFGLATAHPASAASPTEVLEAFYAHANAIIRTVDPLGDLEQPRQAIRDLVNDVFDFRGAAALALGPAWLARTPEDQAEFVRLFGVFLERGFIGMIASKASLSDGVKISYVGESITGQAAGVATTLLTRNGLGLPVDYWFVRRGESWKIQDVVIDGVSLIANYRAQFARVLGSYPYAEVIARMGGNLPETTPLVVATAPEAQQPVVAAIPARAQDPGTEPATTPIMQAAAPPQPVTPPMEAAAPPAPRSSPSPMMQPVPPPATVLLAPWIRQEIHLAAVARVQPPAERPRVSLDTERPTVATPEPAAVARPERAGESQAVGPYWVQLGAFQSVDAAGHLADRYRRDGATISQFWLTNNSGNRVGMWARVRLGPFANRSDALSKVKELTARGQTSFIAGARD